MTEESRAREKVDSERTYDEQSKRSDKEWMLQIDDLRMELLTQKLKIESLTKETEVLRDERVTERQALECSEAAERSLENELKQCKWELQDFRSTSNRVVQDLRTQLSASAETQKEMAAKYERKLTQAELRVQEINDRQVKAADSHNEIVADLNNELLKVKRQLAGSESELAEARWQLDDTNKAKDTILENRREIEDKLKARIDELERNEEGKSLKEEANRLKKMLETANQDLCDKDNKIQVYREQLVAANDKMSELERQRAKLELDCQKKCDDLKRSEQGRSESIIQHLTRAKEEADASVRKLGKEVKLHKQAIVSLKKDRDSAFDTLRDHGLKLAPPVFDGTTDQTRSTSSASEVRALQEQNDSLRAVISQMRREMETLSQPVAQSGGRDNLYVASLEEQIRLLKSELREKAVEFSSEKAVVSSDILVDESDVIKALSNDIGSLRSEKVELTAHARKQQVEIQRLRSELKRLQSGPNSMRLELDQLKYELNASRRQLEVDRSSSQSRVKDLERQLAVSQEEASTYHHSLLAANAELQSLGNELSELKMAQVKAQTTVNYGAQELVIQTLEDEVRHSLVSWSSTACN